MPRNWCLELEWRSTSKISLISQKQTHIACLCMRLQIGLKKINLAKNENVIEYKLQRNQSESSNLNQDFNEELK